jgi:hypothetical protein
MWYSLCPRTANEAVFVASFHSCFMYESKQTDEVKSGETKLIIHIFSIFYPKSIHIQ